MHELSIVMGIVDIAEEQVRKAGAHTVDRIELDIGSLAGIELDALDFAWDAATRDTVLAKAIRDIHHIQAKARCCDCGHEYPIEQVFDPCPACGEIFSDVVQGQELRVKALTVS
jgi:hydrogenase nickel incorporation protein HypA/HybF